SEAAEALAQAAAGIGLFRTEFLFLARRGAPSEEEQVGFYRKLLIRMGGRPVTVRTFDLRPADLVSGGRGSVPMAEAFDWRKVLESPPAQELFKTQVRAVLRAGSAGPLRLLVPFVTRSEQLEFVREVVERSRAELQQEGLPFGE